MPLMYTASKAVDCLASQAQSLEDGDPANGQHMISAAGLNVEGPHVSVGCQACIPAQ